MLNTTSRRHDGPLRVAVLCSHRAPGLLHLLNQCPDRGIAYEIVCCLTSERTFAEEVRVERRGIPTMVHPIREFCEARDVSVYHDMNARSAYDAATLQRIEPYFPDLLLLDGYLYLITAPLLRAFPNRVLNLHYSDLTLRRRDGGPMFPGLRAVRDAILGGCHETRATVHVVNEEPDGGAPVVGSWGFPVSALVDELRTQIAEDAMKAYVYAHQQWMLRTVSGPLVAAALRLVASGAVDLDAAAAAGDAHNIWLLDKQRQLVAPEAEIAAH